MHQTIKNIIEAVCGAVWGVPLLIFIVGVGLFISLSTRFFQFRRFGLSLKTTLGKITCKQNKNGGVTPFQAVCTALAATVGTGNIAGVAGAIALGGPGAVFWMWVSAFLGMSVKTAEIMLSVYYRQKNSRGEFVGGPMYFIRGGLGRKYNWLAYCYAIMGVLTVFGIGSAVQVNTIAESLCFTVGELIGKRAAGTIIFKLAVGIAVFVFAARVLCGGAEKTGRVSEKLVPVMALFYAVLAAGVIIINIKRVPAVFIMIFKGAFSPASVTGGAVGSVMLTLKNGVSRGIFSNEAGLGTAGIAHSSAKTDDIYECGLFGIFEVFADTVVICTLTALVILLGGISVNYGDAAGAEIAICAFKSVYGEWVSVFLCAALCSFALSTVIGWGLYGLRCFEFLFGTDMKLCFFVIYALSAIIGAAGNMNTVWQISETVNALMAIPNLTGVVLLSPQAVKLIKKYDKTC